MAAVVAVNHVASQTEPATAPTTQTPAVVAEAPDKYIKLTHAYIRAVLPGTEARPTVEVELKGHSDDNSPLATPLRAIARFIRTYRAKLVSIGGDQPIVFQLEPRYLPSLFKILKL